MNNGSLFLKALEAVKLKIKVVSDESLLSGS